MLLAAGCAGRTAAPRRSVADVERTTFSPPASPDATTGQLDVRSFGAVGDGRTDDTAALQRAFDRTPPGSILIVPARHTFRHSAVLTISTPRLTLAGTGTLSASQESASSLQLLADDITVRDITLAVPVVTRRWSAPAQHRLYLGAHSSITVEGVVVTGSAAAGIFSDGAQHFSITAVQVMDTRADGVHMTNGSAFGTVTDPQVSRSGDDAVAVVSYEQDGRGCHDITVTRPVVRTTTGGRGVSVVGGQRVSYRDIDVDRSAAAGVYVACEGSPYDTFPALDVTVSGGVVTRANTDAAVDHGAVLVYCGRSGGRVADVVVADLTISGTRQGASRQIGAVHDAAGDVVGDVTFRDLTLAASPTPYEGNVAASSVVLADVTAGGRPVHV